MPTFPTLPFVPLLLAASTTELPETPPPSERLGVVLFGDAGTGGPGQREVALAVKAFCATEPCDFVALLGDNVYNKGVRSVDDPSWKIVIEDMYGDLGLDFRPVLGNHDYQGDIRAQIDRSAVTPWWVMPATWYGFSVGPVDFFALDTNDLDRTQRRWIEDALAASTARWKVVYGHHPVYSYGKHGGTRDLQKHLRPVLEGAGVDFYFSGHDHDRQILRDEGPVVYVVSGAGAHTRSTREGAETLFASTDTGFAHLLIDGDKATLRMVNANGQVDATCDLLKTLEERQFSCAYPDDGGIPGASP